MQISVYFFHHKITDKLLHRHTVRVIGVYFRRTELYLGLALEYRVLERYGYSRHKSHTYIGIFHIFTVKVSDTLTEILAESTLVRTALYRMLSIYKRIVLLAVLIGMCEYYLYIFALEVYYRV